MADNTQPLPNADAETIDDLDAVVDQEIVPEGTQQPDAMNLDGANDTEAPQRNGVPAEHSMEARIPAKKDATLREFLSKMDDYAPIVCLAPLLESPLLTRLDTRCSHQLLSDPRRPATSSPNVATPCAAPCARDPEVHRRHCRRCPQRREGSNATRGHAWAASCVSYRQIPSYCVWVFR